MSNLSKEMKDSLLVGLSAALVFLAVVTGIVVFAWRAFSFSTHTLAWLIFIFGSVFGAVKVRVSK